MASSLQFVSGGAPVRMFAEEVAPADEPSGRRPAILLLHGSGGHVDYWIQRLGPLLKEARLGLYAPHYFDRTGTSRANLATITDGVHVPQWLDTLDAALATVAARPGVDPQRIVLAGISLGAFLALAFAAQLSSSADEQAPRRVRALIDISGGLVAPYLHLATSKMPPTLVIHGEADSVVPVSFARDLAQQLSSLGVQHRTEMLAGEGHWFSATAASRILLAVSSFLDPLLR